MSQMPTGESPLGGRAPEIPSPIVNPGARMSSASHPSPYPPVIVHTQRSGWSRFSSWLGWTGFLFCAMALIGLRTRLADYFDTSGGITEKFVSGAEFGTDKIAVITISGPILEGDGFAKRQIDRIRDDDNVKGVVVRIDSPGGTVTGSDFIYHHLKKLRTEKLKKLDRFPMIVSMGSMAASGGYYIAMAVEDQEKSIFAEPTTTTGSIGVIIPHYDITGLMAEYGVKDDSIATHPRKQMLSMTKELTAEDREVLHAYINDSFTRFKNIIKEGRPHFEKDADALNQLATGEVFTASQALKNGLIDEIGFVEAAIDRTLELAGLEKEKTRVVKFEAPVSLFGMSFANATAMRSPLDLAAFVDFSAPRAYYLCTSLPPIVTTRMAK